MNRTSYQHTMHVGAIVARIARDHLRVETIHTRGRRQLDSYNVHVSDIVQALAAAYKAGLSDGELHAQAAQRRLAEIVGLCAQEGHDGEPWDTINAIATGEYSTRGGGTT